MIILKMTDIMLIDTVPGLFNNVACLYHDTCIAFDHIFNKLNFHGIKCIQFIQILSCCYEGLKWIYRTHHAFPSYVNVGTLNNALLKCSVSSWDVRDSALNFL